MPNKSNDPDKSPNRVERNKRIYSNKKSSRRSFLKKLGLLGVSAAALMSGIRKDDLFPVSEGSSQSTYDEEISFDQTRDAVEHFGLDPNGNNDISGTLSSLPEGTLVVFPEGEYLVEGQINIDNSRIGFKAADGSNVKFLFGNRDVNYFLSCRGEGKDKILFKGIDLDCSRYGDQGRSTQPNFDLHVNSYFKIEDVEQIGRGGGNGGHMFRFTIRDTDGVGLLKNVVVKKGSVAKYMSRGGAFGSSEHKGILRVENCDFREFSNNGMYVARTPGHVQVVDSKFVNNAVTQLRLSGKKTFLRNTELMVDWENHTAPNSEDYRNFPDHNAFGGIGVEQSRQDSTVEEFPIKEHGVSLENCKIHYKSINPTGGSPVRIWGSWAHTLEIENCDFIMENGSVNSVIWRQTIDAWGKLRKDSPDGEAPDTVGEPYWIKANKVTFTGNANMEEVIDIGKSWGHELQNICINMPNANIGVEFREARGSISDSNINVSGEQIKTDSSSDVQISNISGEASCSLHYNTDEESGNNSNTGSDGNNQGILCYRLSKLMKSGKGAEVVEPGNLVQKTKSLPDSTGGGKEKYRSGPVPFRLLKLKVGATYRPTEPIHLKRGVQIHAKGATIEPQHDGPTFILDPETKVYKGTIDLGSIGATAFKHREGTSYPRGPEGTKIVAEPGTGARGLVIDFPGPPGNDNFRQLAWNRAFIETVGVDYPFVLSPRKPDIWNWYNSNDYFVRAKDYKKAIQVKDPDGTNISDKNIASNRFSFELHPTDRADTAVEIDRHGGNEEKGRTKKNWFEGIVNNPKKNDHVFAVRLKNQKTGAAMKSNKMAEYNGNVYESSPEFVRDTSIDIKGGGFPEENGMIDFSEASLSSNDQNPYSSQEANRDVLVADGSNFEQKLQEAVESDSDIRMKSGTDTTISNVTIPENVAVDARGARFVIKNGNGFIYKNGALLIGARIRGRASANTRHLIRADNEIINKPTGPILTTGKSNPNSGSSTRIEALNGGKITGLKNSYHSKLGGKASLDVRADSQSEIVGNELYAMCRSQGKQSVKIRGEGVIEDNFIWLNVQSNGANINGLYIDGPNVRNNIFQGIVWDHHLYDDSGYRIVRSGGGNHYVNIAGHQHFPNSGKPTLGKYNNTAGTDDRMIGLDKLDEVPEIRARVAKERLLPQEFSPICFGSGSLPEGSATGGVTELTISSENGEPTNYLVETNGDIAGPGEQLVTSSSSSSGTSDDTTDDRDDGQGQNTQKDNNNDTDKIPDADSDDFESALREVVGAKEGKSWQEFCDSDNRNVHNVKQDYGAAMDGQTDDRQAFQDALKAAANENPSGIVLIPEGTLAHRDAIGIRPEHEGVCLVGEGKNTEIKQLSGGSRDGYWNSGIFFDMNDGESISNIHLANFRLNQEDGRAGITTRNIEGENVMIENIWVENSENHAGMHLTFSGLHIKNITCRNNGGHGLALNNGLPNPREDDVEAIMSIDPDELLAENIHVYGNDKGGTNYGIDVSAGANTTVNKFISEKNGQGMKVPHTNNATIKNGLFKQNSYNGFQINDSKPTNVILDNLKADRRNHDPKGGYGFRIFGSHVKIGKIVSVGGPNSCWLSGWRDGQEIPTIHADTIILEDSGGKGAVFDGTEARIKKLTCKNNSGTDVSVNGDRVTVENLDADSVSGNVNKKSVSAPDI